MTGNPEMVHVGEALHGFLAADRPDLLRDQRLETARGLINRWEINDSLTPDSVLQTSDQLQNWIKKTWPGARYHREWPVSLRMESGTWVTGFVDLVLRIKDGFVVIDHKSFPGSIADAIKRALEFGGQLWSYGAAIERATGLPVVGKFIHLPISGMVVEIGDVS